MKVVAGGQSWAIRRTHNNIQMLDSQLHRCVWDRTFSLLEKVHQESAVDQLQQQHVGVPSLSFKISEFRLTSVFHLVLLAIAVDIH